MWNVGFDCGGRRPQSDYYCTVDLADIDADGYVDVPSAGMDRLTVDCRDGVMVAVDPMSFQYLVGAEVDYKEDLEGARFVINNPNATTTCGCGSSFSI